MKFAIPEAYDTNNLVVQSSMEQTIESADAKIETGGKATPEMEETIMVSPHYPRWDRKRSTRLADNGLSCLEVMMSEVPARIWKE